MTSGELVASAEVRCSSPPSSGDSVARGAGGYRRRNSRIRRTTCRQASCRCVTSWVWTVRCASFRVSRRSASLSAPGESGANEVPDESDSPVPGSGSGCALDGYHRPSDASQEPGVNGETTDMTDLSLGFRRGVVPMRGGKHLRASCQVRVPSGHRNTTTWLRGRSSERPRRFVGSAVHAPSPSNDDRCDRRTSG